MGVMGVRAVPWDPYFTLPRIGCQAEEPRVLLSGNVGLLLVKTLDRKRPLIYMVLLFIGFYYVIPPLEKAIFRSMWKLV